MNPEPAIANGGYPPGVNRIIMTHCSGGGCHNAIGAPNAAGLRLDDWDKLFDGSIHGAVVIPFDTVNSSLLHYVNNDSALGPLALPQMPYTASQKSSSPLTRAEYDTLRAWIAAGAPDKSGNIPFGSEATTRQKIYITQQGSDIVSVVDAARMVVMRNIPVGMSSEPESPHCVRVSKDGQSAYVSFLAGDYIQRIETSTDRVVGQVKISNGDASWNSLHISDDGSKLIAADLLRGRLVVINTAGMQVLKSIEPGIINPHGLASSRSFDTILITAQFGNSILKLFANGSSKLLSIDGAGASFTPGLRDPYDILMTPDYASYFVSCQWSNEVRVLDARNDTLKAVFNVPSKPQALVCSRRWPYMFVSCPEAASPVTGSRGAVVVINYESMQIVKIIRGSFWQPQGMAVDDAHGTFYIVNTNQTGGSAGHNHSAAGKRGWYNVYSIETLETVTTRRFETLVLPYSADSRFK